MSNLPAESHTLPGSAVLSYITPRNALTPTRVRNVASWSVFVIGIILTLIGLVGGFFLALEALKIFRWVHSYSDFQDWLRYRDTGDLIGYAIVISLETYALGCGAFTFLLFRPIRRGKGWACVFAILIILPLLAFEVLVSAIVATAAFLPIFMPAGRPIEWMALLWLLPAAIIALLALLSVDIFRYLRWIRRNPLAESPPVKFVG